MTSGALLNKPTQSWRNFAILLDMLVKQVAIQGEGLRLATSFDSQI